MRERSQHLFGEAAVGIPMPEWVLLCTVLPDWKTIPEPEWNGPSPDFVGTLVLNAELKSMGSTLTWMPLPSSCFESSMKDKRTLR